MSQTSENFLPAATGQTLGSSGQRWNGIFQDIDVSRGMGLPSLAFASLPTAGTAGRLARISDRDRSVYLDTGTQWVSLTGNVIDVKRFGAKGDGTTNDTTAISDAISALSNGYILFFPAGTYKITSQLTISGLTGFQVCGAGARATKLDAGGAIASGAILKIYNCLDFEISNLAIWGESLADYGLWMDAGSGAPTGTYSVRNVEIIKAVVEGIRIADSVVNNYQVDWGTFSACWLFGNGHNVGIHSTNAINNTFVGCQMAASGATTPTHNLYIEGGEATVLSSGMASASQYDIYKAPSSFFNAFRLYSESNKLINAPAGGAADYTSSIVGLTQNVDNTGVDVISWASSNGVIFQGCRFGGNVNVAYASNFSEGRNNFFLSGNGFTGTALTLQGNSSLISSQTSAAGIGNGADATDDTLFTYTLPANALGSNGRTIRVVCTGSTAANGNNKTVKLWFGGGAIVTPISAVASNNESWVFDTEIARVDSTHISVRSTGQRAATIFTATISPNVVVGDLGTNTNVIKVTGLSGSSAANDVLGYAMRIEFLN